MISSLLRLVSTACVVVLALSFLLFAADQAKSGSEQQIARLGEQGGESDSSSGNINRADPGERTERARERRRGPVREAVDDANDVLVKPFAGLVDGSDSIWVQRGVPSLLALLAFGVLLRIAAAYVRI